MGLLRSGVPGVLTGRFADLVALKQKKKMQLVVSLNANRGWKMTKSVVFPDSGMIISQHDEPAIS